jgi:hypothetical protein
MNREQLRLAYQGAKDTGRLIVGYGVVGLASLGGAGAGGYLGYRAGNAVAPDAETMAGKVLEHSVELATTGALGTIGAMIGFGVGVWMVDEDGMRDNF